MRLAKNPNLGRQRNRRAVWLGNEGQLRFDQAVASPSPGRWRVAQGSLQRALEAFDLLEKEGALVTSSIKLRNETVARQARCTKEL